MLPPDSTKSMSHGVPLHIRLEQQKEQAMEVNYLMARKFHLKKGVNRIEGSNSTLKFFQGASNEESYSFPSVASATESPVPTMNKTMISSVKQSKAVRHPSLMKLMSRPNQESLFHQAATENEELIEQIKQMKFFDVTLWQMIELMATNFKSLLSYKNDRAAMVLVERVSSFQIRFKELRSMLLSNSKPKDWTSEFLMRRIVSNYTKVLNHKRTMKRHRIEKVFLQTVFQFNQKLEELNMKCCEDLYHTLELQIQEQTTKLQSKEQEISKQFQKSGQQSYFISNVLQNKHQVVPRRLVNSNCSLLSDFEEKYGTFHNIKNLTRHTSYMINNVISCLQKQ